MTNEIMKKHNLRNSKKPFATCFVFGDNKIIYVVIVVSRDNQSYHPNQFSICVVISKRTKAFDENNAKIRFVIFLINFGNDIINYRYQLMTKPHMFSKVKYWFPFPFKFFSIQCLLTGSNTQMIIKESWLTSVYLIH